MSNIFFTRTENSITNSFNDYNIKFSLLSAPVNYIIQEDEISVFYLRDNFLAVVKNENNSFYYSLTNNSNISVTAGLEINNLKGYYSYSSQRHDLYFDEFKVELYLDDCSAEIEDSGFMLLRAQNESSRFYIKFITPEIQSLSFEAKALQNSVFVEAGMREPEFAIGVFDDSNFTRPRDVRLGTPVISTVPTSGTTTTTGEKDSIELGEGFPSRVMHFKIVCDTIIETGMTTGSLSALKLSVSMPSGLDTVKEPEYAPIYFVSYSADNTTSVYRASFEFYKEDTIKYVDGYLYLDVICPMIVQKTLPISFEII